MAYVDLDDQIASNGDYILTDGKMYKAYNLLSHTFPDMPEIGLDIASMIAIGASSSQIDGVILAYLSDFKCDPHQYLVNYSNQSGRLEFSIQYNPSNKVIINEK